MTAAQSMRPDRPHRAAKRYIYAWGDGRAEGDATMRDLLGGKGAGLAEMTSAGLPVGHGMRMIGPKGRFLLEPDDQRTHLYISTGTGVAPFISMIRETMAAGDRRRTVLIHGCSYQDELGYRPILEGWQQDGSYPLTYVPTISRPHDPRNAGWTGRTGRAEAIVSSVCGDLGLEPERTVVYICGNPEMILNVERVLMGRGFPEFHVKKELYWPKGKEPVPAPQA